MKPAKRRQDSIRATCPVCNYRVRVRQRASDSEWIYMGHSYFTGSERWVCGGSRELVLPERFHRAK
jgi:hypothetical protein